MKNQEGSEGESRALADGFGSMVAHPEDQKEEWHMEGDECCRSRSVRHPAKHKEQAPLGMRHRIEFVREEAGESEIVKRHVDAV